MFQFAQTIISYYLIYENKLKYVDKISIILTITYAFLFALNNQ